MLIRFACQCSAIVVLPARDPAPHPMGAKAGRASG